MQIFLVRHGETDLNLQGRCQGTTDLALNETGVGQAHAVAANLRQHEVQAVYSSKLQRAMGTARAISEPHGLDVIIDDDLRELDHGEFEGLTFIEVRSSYSDFIRQWKDRPARMVIPGGESIADVEQRAWRALDRIRQRHAHQTVVVVSHQFPIAAILCRITGVLLDHYRSFNVKPGGWRRLRHTPTDGWKLLEEHDLGQAGSDRIEHDRLGGS